MFKTTSLILTFSVMLGGCGLAPSKTIQFFEGPVLPASQLATLGERRDYITITHVNGKPIRPYGMGTPSKGVLLKPGQYTLSMQYFSNVSTWTGKAELSIEMKAGHTYVPEMVYFRPQERKVIMTVVDKGTNYPIDCLDTGEIRHNPAKINCPSR